MMKSVYLLFLLLASLVSIGQAQQPTDNQQPNFPLVVEGKKVCVVGNVAKPLEVYFKNRLTVTQAIKEAGGILPSSKNNEVLVISQMIGGKGEMRIIYIDLKAIEKKPYKDLELQDFDIVEVISKKREKRDPKPFINPCPSWPVLKNRL